MKIGTLAVFLISLFAVSSCSAKKPNPLHELRPIIQEVTWPDSSLIDRAVLSLLSEEDKNQISKSNVPVLFFKLIQPMPDLYFIVEPYYYAASLNLNEGTSLFILGTNVAHPVSQSETPSFNCVIRGINGIVNENVGIWSVTWSEYGVGYIVDVECSKQNNPNCSESYIIGLVNNLVYLGGSGR